MTFYHFTRNVPKLGAGEQFGAPTGRSVPLRRRHRRRPVQGPEPPRRDRDVAGALSLMSADAPVPRGWGPERLSESWLLRNVVKKLRRNLGDDAADPARMGARLLREPGPHRMPGPPRIHRIPGDESASGGLLSPRFEDVFQLETHRPVGMAATAIIKVPVPHAMSATLSTDGNSWSLRSISLGRL